MTFRPRTEGPNLKAHRSPFGNLCLAAFTADGPNEPRAKEAVVRAVDQIIAGTAGPECDFEQERTGIPLLHYYLLSGASTPGQLSRLLALPNIDINAVHEGSGNALHAALRHGLQEQAMELIRAGATVGERPEGQPSALTLALHRSYFDEATLMLSSGAPPSDETAIATCIQCYNNDPRYQTMLTRLVRGAGGVSDELLHDALVDADDGALRALLGLLNEAGAGPDPDFFRRNAANLVMSARDWYPRMYQGMERAKDRFDYLASLGVSPDALTGYLRALYEPDFKGHPCTRPRSAQRRALLDHLVTGHGARLCAGILWQACKAGAPSAELALLTQLAPEQINVAGVDGKTPLLTLLWHQVASKAQVRVLLEAGADPDKGLAGDDGGFIPILDDRAGRRLNDSLRELLLDYGASCPRDQAAADLTSAGPGRP